ncbi:MAG TPA: response regulator transcription factor [Jiangellaceae bacterium]|nr:response regulator transcription factor [Jiangellaceae bacterium]
MDRGEDAITAVMLNGEIHAAIIRHDVPLRAHPADPLASALVSIVDDSPAPGGTVERTRWLAPDVVVDGHSNARPGRITATRELTRVAPAARVLILTTFEQDDYVFGALRAGASGFLLKCTRPEELIAAVHTVATGDLLFSPSVTPAGDRPDGPTAHTQAQRPGQTLS